MRKNVDMVNGSLYRSTIKFTLPIIATSILSHLFNITDMIVVGRYCGSNSAGAIGATASIVGLIVNVFIGLGTGAGIVVAQSVGKSDEKAIKNAVHTTIYTALFLGAILTAIGLLASRSMLVAMNTPKELLNLSDLYLRIYFAGIVLRLLYVYGSAILRALGDTETPFKYLTLGGILNVIFNLFFVIVCKMSVDGVAYGTLISEGVSGTLCLAAIMRRKDAARFAFSGLKEHFRFKTLKGIIKIGIPTGVEDSLFSIASIVIQKYVNGFGTAVVTGNAAATSIGQIALLAVSAINATASMFAGQNYGAKRMDRVKKLSKVCIMWAELTLLIFGGVIFILSVPLIKLYIKDSPEAIQVGILKLRMLLLGYIFAGLNKVHTGILRGLGRSTSCMIISLIGICGLRILWITLMLKVYYHPIIIFAGFPISYFVTSIVFAVYHRHVIRKLLKENEQTAAPKEPVAAE